MRKRNICIILFVILALTACATVNVQMTPKRVYYEAQLAYFNAWESYHKVWIALPDTDARKAQWVKDYHPVFLDTAILLQAWGQSPDDYQQGNIVNLAIDKLENILIQLAIKKGV